MCAVVLPDDGFALKLYLDDVRLPPSDKYVPARSTDEALQIIKMLGWPVEMSLDHDLGGDDTTMVFLRRLVDEIWDGVSAPPEYTVHSANPVGAQNIVAFMESWKRSRRIDAQNTVPGC